MTADGPRRSTARTAREPTSTCAVSPPVAVARRVTPRDRWIIRMLHEHTVLTTEQLARLGFASLRTAQQRLQLLHRLDVLDRFQPYRPTGSAPLHHLLGPVGAHILAAEEGLDTAALGYRRQRTLAVAHRLTLSHDIGAATSIIDLATHPHLHLGRWWSAARCAASGVWRSGCGVPVSTIRGWG